MTRKLAVAAVSIGCALIGTSLAPAADQTIQATAPNVWQPSTISVAVGDTVTWVFNDAVTTDGHGVEITNWNNVKGNVEVQTVTGQIPFNSVTGANDNPSTTVNQVLLRLKIKTLPSSDITYDCIVHGQAMSGTVSVTAASVPIMILGQLKGTTPFGQVNDMTPFGLFDAKPAFGQVKATTPFGQVDARTAMLFHTNRDELFLVGEDRTRPGRLLAFPVEVVRGAQEREIVRRRSLKRGKEVVSSANSTSAGITTVKSFVDPLRWEKNAEQIELGKEIQWVNGGGPHGLRITNWNDVRNAVEVIDALGTPENFKTTGATPPSSETDKVFARLKVNSFPPTTDTIEYECVVHGDSMSGTVHILRPAAKRGSASPHSRNREASPKE